MISENKIKHCLGVARACREIAKQKGYSEDFSDAMFVMGLLHDIGYEDEPNSSHGHKSSEMIKSFEVHLQECCDAIDCHGLVFDNWVIYDEILNLADLTTSHEGNKISVLERLKRIEARWGSSSVHYRHAVEVVDKLKELGYDVT